MTRTLTLAAALLAGTIALAQDHANCELHAKHVDQRHDTFGMHHDASTHSFRLFADGGAIELRAKDASDEKTVAAIRKHLPQVAGEFAKADFSTPAFVHGYPPDGVETMKRLQADITYRYQELPGGGRIRITTKSAGARAAIHDFLRFQVAEHRTANSGKVEEDQ